ncbi:hypothetical protein L6164_025419 [Bauhinia variegata]|uniref:Uncharacterized protein n=1 Tax=Bauhinia variegata TaxID=167791 RepID=A0ACB9M3P6_BAUVA|nr:hypothetical protein L6164_025419 [Bauhinia variegata]
MTKVLNSSMELSNNALDMVAGFSDFLKDIKLGFGNRKLMSASEEATMDDGFPSWRHHRLVFGDAAVIFQRCDLIVRKPLDNQNCIVAAGGRMKPLDPNGLQMCHFTAEADYLTWRATSGRTSYLARPWKPYAKTVIIDSTIDGILNPKDYIDLQGAAYHQTCTALEFNNQGPGGDTSQRVKWPGVKVLSNTEVASYYPLNFYEMKDTDKDSFIYAPRVPYNPI